MASKKKIIKGIESIGKRIAEHEEKLAKALSEDARSYLSKDIERLKKQKKKKEKQV